MVNGVDPVVVQQDFVFVTWLFQNVFDVITAQKSDLFVYRLLFVFFKTSSWFFKVN